MIIIMANDNILQFKELFDEQKAQGLISIQSLDDILSNIVSIEDGVDVIRSYHPSIIINDIINQITSLDLLYLSLVHTLPNGVDPLIHNWAVNG